MSCAGCPCHVTDIDMVEVPDCLADGKCIFKEEEMADTAEAVKESDPAAPIKHKCAYCGALRGENELFEDSVFCGPYVRTGWYCGDKPCHSYHQFSMEG